MTARNKIRFARRAGLAGLFALAAASAANAATITAGSTTTVASGGTAPGGTGDYIFFGGPGTNANAG
ncbi:MAG TPA: hypothetical protein VHY57_08145, partial [Rhizomicrobium sp.]|nr:hypothetical protein [Rhizomicrobium sp.]